EVRPDDFQPKRVPQNVRHVAVCDGLIDNIPALDPALVASNDGVDVVAHSLQQFFAGSTRAVVSAKGAAKSSAPELICRGRIRVRSDAGRDVCGRWIRPRENPIGCLAVPHQRVPYDVHLVAQTEVHEGVRRAELVALSPFTRMNELPLRVIFRRDLIEVFLDESNVLCALLRAPAESCAAS